MTKNNLLYICLAAMLLFAACTRATKNPENINGANSPAEAEELIVINWGILNRGDPASLDPDIEFEIVSDIADMFGVAINLMIMPNATLDINVSVNDLPDFFLAYDFETVLFNSGVLRPIPHDMITQHAPRYAARMSVEPYGWDLGRAPGQDGYYFGLNVYHALMSQPMQYSQYRFDWLIDLGINPNGNVSKLRGGEVSFYFTDEAFTQDQFVDIIRAFANRSDNSSGVLVPARQEFITTYFRPIIGMFGLIPDIINCGGRAVPYYASGQYRDFMRFLSDLHKEDLLLFASKDDAWANPPELIRGRIGWNVGVPSIILNYYGVIAFPNENVNLFLRDPDAKLLVAPPEIGLSGMQGFYSLNTSFLTSIKWFVSAAVTDEKLAKILQIFDALSFDPEFHVLSNYGVEGVDFTWEGEPYNSRAIQNTSRSLQESQRRGAGGLNTLNMEDGFLVYQLGNNALTQFASSPRTAQMAIRPYKEDMFGLFTDQRAELDLRFEERLRQVRQDFYYNVATGGITDVDAEWDRYIAGLYANGLSEYIALFEQF